MPTSPSKRLVQRWTHRFAPAGALQRMVDALQTLLEVASGQDPLFLLRGMDLLVEHLGAEVAYLAMPEGPGFEVRWWSPEVEGIEGPRPVPCFCQWLQANPFRMMVLRNLRDEPQWLDHPELRDLGLGAAVGGVLRDGATIRGLLFLHFKEPRPLDRSDLALIDAVAGFLAKVLEVEHLKFSLERMENALAITKAVVEDSSIQDTTTRLPNLRYLDIWLKANAAVAQELMTVALWQLPPDAASDRMLLQTLGESIRGGDLLVSVGQNRFLIVLQRTAKGMGHLFLLRLRHKIGEWPMGATVWVPGQDDAHFESVRGRCERALAASHTAAATGLVWSLAEAEA